MTNQLSLAAVTKPGRYLGTEYNSVQKNWDSTLARFALVFPDLYEIGMSHHGLQILYHLLNQEKEFLAERCYCPDLDMERLLRQSQQPLASLESARPLTSFDVIGITLPYELCFSNILTILDLADIPLYAKDRGHQHPVILGGGAGSFNPEPVADFFDAILLGDGEEAILEIAQVVARQKTLGSTKEQLLHELSKISGIYIPANFQATYGPHGTITAVHNVCGTKSEIKRRVLSKLDATEHLQHPLVPNAKIVHDRLGLEIARGCTRGCRFCQAGIIYRPVRERTPQQIANLAESGIDNSGFEELALLSLSTGDYSCLNQVLPTLMDEFSPRYVSVAMPSLRVGTLTPQVIEQIKRVRKTGFTLAPEAGSERMRQVINKGITEEDLLTACNDAFAAGWQSIKLYFMIGLPTETEADIDEIAALAKKILSGKSAMGQTRARQLTISVGTFIPKPHTPFQWAKQLSMEESMEKIQHLKRILPAKRCNLRYHSPRQSFLEGVFSRGDRRLSRLIETAWQNGARLDGWDEHFELSRWQQAAEICNVSLEAYLEERPLTAILPWQHLQTGVSLQFLRTELEKAKQLEYTPDCRYHTCQQCGVCDFKEIQPRVVNKTRSDDNCARQHSSTNRINAVAEHFRYIVHYQRRGKICFLGHLEMLQTIFRTLRRAKIDTNFSQGFNPSPKVSFSPALPAGTESLAEFFIMDLPKVLTNYDDTMAILNKKLPPGLTVTSLALHGGSIPQNLLISYTLTLPGALDEGQQSAIESFVASPSFMANKVRKGKTAAIDIRPLITTINIVATDILYMEVKQLSAQPGVKPVEALTQILSLDQKTALAVKILKTAWKAIE